MTSGVIMRRERFRRQHRKNILAELTAKWPHSLYEKLHNPDLAWDAENQDAFDPHFSVNNFSSSRRDRMQSDGGET